MATVRKRSRHIEVLRLPALFSRSSDRKSKDFYEVHTTLEALKRSESWKRHRGDFRLGKATLRFNTCAARFMVAATYLTKDDDKFKPKSLLDAPRMSGFPDGLDGTFYLTKPLLTREEALAECAAENRGFIAEGKAKKGKPFNWAWIVELGQPIDDECEIDVRMAEVIGKAEIRGELATRLVTPTAAEKALYKV